MIASNRTQLFQAAWMLALGLVSVFLSVAFAWISPMEFGEAWIRNTARLSLVWYWLAAMLMLFFDREDWLAETWIGSQARWCWLLGIIAFWLHVCVAFHYQHHWSHARAFEHVQAASGFGYGIYVSYFFTIAWTIDGLWWAFRARSYAVRPKGFGYGLHAFMLFIVFNSTVVFETGAIRWIGWLLLASLALAWGIRRFTHFRPSFT